MPQGYSLLLLRNSQHKFLLQLRTDDAPTFPDCWGFFGGAIESDEDPLTAVIREAKEELAYDCLDPKLICSVNPDSLDYPLHGGARHYFVEDFDQSQILAQSEGKGMDWFSLQEMKSINLAPHNHEVLPILEREFYLQNL